MKPIIFERLQLYPLNLGFQVGPHFFWRVAIYSMFAKIALPKQQPYYGAFWYEEKLHEVKKIKNRPLASYEKEYLEKNIVKFQECRQIVWSFFISESFRLMDFKSELIQKIIEYMACEIEIPTRIGKVSFTNMLSRKPIVDLYKGKYGYELLVNIKPGEIYQIHNTLFHAITPNSILFQEPVGEGGSLYCNESFSAIEVGNDLLIKELFKFFATSIRTNPSKGKEYSLTKPNGDTLTFTMG